MYNNYTYSHTIKPQHNNPTPQQKKPTTINVQSSEEQLDDLFVIGGRKIVRQGGEGDDRDRKERKEKKIRKEGKQKKQKKDKKKDKDKHKDKHKKKHKSKKSPTPSNHSQQQHSTPIIKIQSSQSQSQQNPTPKKPKLQPRQQQDNMQKLQQKLLLLSKYQKQLTNYQLSQNPLIIDKEFGLNQKISQNALALDIIKFGMPQLYNFGLQDRDIPYYKRHHALNTIIGLKKKKRKMAKLMRQLNLTTNQVGLNWSKYDNISQDRYFHYTGYHKLQGIMPQKYQIITSQKQQTQSKTQPHPKQLQLQTYTKTPINHPNPHLKPTIQFNPPSQLKQKLPNNEQKLKMMLRQYNVGLNANPNRIGLWLKFLDAQDKISQLTHANSQIEKSQLQKIALNQRKISIIQKALQKNPNNHELGLKYLSLLSQTKKDRKIVQQTTKSLLQSHPDSPQLWQFLLTFKLTNLVDYKHTRLQKQYQQITTYLFKKRINQVKSGKQVWKIRKCGLAILQEILTVHRLEGYYQLCTAICCALLEFNIFCGDGMLEFSREERLGVFREYWEDYRCYKLGECFLQEVCESGEPQEGKQQCKWIPHTWQAYLKTKNQPISLDQPQPRYIGSLFSSSPNTRWLPCHTLHNQQQISLHPQTFILFQDIQLYLQKYRNIQNWKLICNMTMSNINMPPIFSPQQGSIINHEEQLTNWLSQTLINHRSLESPYNQHCFILWCRYWHPGLVLEFLGVQGGRDRGGGQVMKFGYAVGIVQAVYRKMVVMGQNGLLAELRQYLMFLYGTIYHLHSRPQITTQPIQNLLTLYPTQTCLSKIQTLLTSDPTNINLWSMYIQYERHTGKQVNQCIQCYLSCINMMIDQNANVQILKKLYVLYFFIQFLYRWGYGKEGGDKMLVLGVLRIVLLDQGLRQYVFSLQNVRSQIGQLQALEKLLMANKLKSLFKQSQTKTSYTCLIYYMMLELGQSPPTILPLLLPLTQKTPLATSILIDFNLLQLQDISTYNLMQYNCNLKVITYFSRLLAACSNGVPFMIYHHFMRYCGNVRKRIVGASGGENSGEGDFYQEESKRRLGNWLLVWRVLEAQYRESGVQLTESFARVAQYKLANIHQPACMQILNQLLMNPDFSYEWINCLPYCRKIYEVAIKSPEKEQKVRRLVMEKQIRYQI